MMTMFILCDNEFSRLWQPIISIIDCDDGDGHHHHDDHCHYHHNDHLERHQSCLLPDESAERAADAEDGKAQEETNPDDDDDGVF